MGIISAMCGGMEMSAVLGMASCPRLKAVHLCSVRYCSKIVEEGGWENKAVKGKYGYLEESR